MRDGVRYGLSLHSYLLSCISYSLMVDPLPTTSELSSSRPVEVDIGDDFEKIMRSRHLKTWDQVREAIDILHKTTYTHYVVRESKVNKENPELYYRYVVYICTFGHKKKPEGTGQRVKGSKFTGCKSMFRIRYEHTRSIICTFKTIHTHPCNREYLTNDPWYRKLSDDQLQIVTPMIVISSDPKGIIKYIDENFNKPIPINDYKTLRHKVFKAHQKKQVM
uniref:SJCHGC01513 protein n=1 Tax=Schistosoma japonicum TaxID=6182 RepID=Q5DFT8_SCHJA|nr:SJCHGC01513 protein [Schistosoma japonicum]